MDRGLEWRFLQRKQVKNGKGRNGQIFERVGGIMKIQYASDLHLEFPENKKFILSNPLKPLGDILVLSGDIVPFYQLDKHKDFFNYLSDYFETTYWVPGNHEYYHMDLATKSGTLNESIRTNIHLVNNFSTVKKGGRLIFSTLWSRISPVNFWHVEQNINDFHLIKYKGERFTVDEFNQLHEESLAFLNLELSKTGNFKTQVFTHHVPTLMNYPLKYKHDVLNEAFAVELFHLIESSGADNWVYGHHHCATNRFNIGTTKLLTNQLGYVERNEHLAFNDSAYIEIIDIVIQ